MKIALVVPGFSAHEGDWSIPASLDFVRELAGRAEVHVYTLRWPEHGERYHVFGATVLAMNGRKRMGWRVVDLWQRTLRALAAEHERGAFDVIHAFWADEPAWVGTMAARRLRIPLVVSVRGGELVGFPALGYGLQRLRGRRALVRASLRAATRVTAGSAYLEAIARNWPTLSGKLERAPFGVDTTRFAPAPTRHDAARGRVLNVGSLHPVKGQRHLLRAFAGATKAETPQATSSLATATLTIVGDGPDRQDLQGLASTLGSTGRVRFAGAVPHGDMPRVYRDHDLLVQASVHEGQGMALLEAAACGLPAVGTPVGVLPEIGRAVTTIDQLAAAVDELLRQSELRRQLGDEARARVEQEFSLPVCMARFFRIYDSIAGRR